MTQPQNHAEPLLLACPFCGTANGPARRYCSACRLPLGRADHIGSAEADRRADTRRRAASRDRVQRLVFLAAIAALAAIVAYVYLDDSAPRPAVAPGIQSASPASQWTMSGHDLGNSRYAKDGPRLQGRVAWRFVTSEPFFASPTFANGKVYAATGDRRIVALDGASGALLWQFAAGVPIDSAPAIAGDRVIVGLRDGRLVALSATSGAELWTYDTESIILADPVVSAGTVYIGDGEGRLHAVDAQTGRLRWRGDKHSGETIGLAVAISGDRVIVGAGGRIRVYDTDTGKETAWHRLSTAASADPVSVGDDVYIGGGRGVLRSLDPEWRPPLLFRGPGRFIWTNLYVVDMAPRPPTGFRWAQQFGTGDIRRMAVSDDTLYFATSAGDVMSIDRASQERRWTYRMPVGTTGATVVAGDTAYVGDMNGTLHAVDIRSGQPRWTLKTGGPITTSPAAGGSALYVTSSDGTLYAIE